MTVFAIAATILTAGGFLTAARSTHNRQPTPAWDARRLVHTYTTKGRHHLTRPPRYRRVLLAAHGRLRRAAT